MRYPHSLPEHGCLGFIAPSFGCAIEPYHSAFLRGLDVLRSRGYRTVTGPNALLSEGVGISNTADACGEEVNDFFSRPDLDAIISCGGGELMCTILDYVNFDALREKVPKWFMGFSDNTNLSFLLPTLCDTAAIYGPCAPVFGMEPWHPVVHDSLALLSGLTDCIESYGHWQLEGGKDEEHPYAPYHTTKETILKKLPENASRIHMEGRLLGGCLDVLSVLAGTEYDRVPAFTERYSADGILWFLEACDLNPFDIQRALWKLAHCGWFRNARGFLIGRPLHFGEELMGLNQYNAVTNILGTYKLPIIMDADLGHLPPSMPLITGAYGMLDCVGNDIRIQFKKR